jgi:hypothetical protein
MTQTNSSHSERLLAGLALVAALTADAALLPASLMEAAAAAELPKAAAEDVLQVLADPAVVAACLQLVITPTNDAAKGAGAAVGDGTLLRQAVSCVLQYATAAEPEVAAAFGACQACLPGLVKLVAVGSTRSSTPDAVKVSVLQLLYSLSSSAAEASAATSAAAVAMDGAAPAVPALAAAPAVKELVEQHKIIPCFVQMLGEVRVVKGRPAVSLGRCGWSRAGLQSAWGGAGGQG